MTTINLTATATTPNERSLQEQVRTFLDQRLPEGTYDVSLGISGISDRNFSRDLRGNLIAEARTIIEHELDEQNSC